MAYGEEVNITPISDAHVDSQDCDYAALTNLIQSRASLPNHRGILLGDNQDLVVPTDLKRWRPSVQHKDLVGKDDWVNASVRFAVERLKIPGITWDLVVPGNHEDEFLKRHGVDTTSMLAFALNTRRGGYSGILEYILRLKSGPGKPHGHVFRIAYHHGAWGGRVIKGFGGARDWFRAFDDWHVALWGHNHQSHAHREWRLRPGGNRLEKYSVYFVNCGSWVDTYSDEAGRTHYGERQGYAPSPTSAPLIRVKIAGGDPGPGGYSLAYSVEV